jgi:hypothetical protein
VIRVARWCVLLVLCFLAGVGLAQTAGLVDLARWWRRRA